MQRDNDLLFIDDEPDEPNIPGALDGGQAWKVLIIDDDQEVHSITKLVLSDFVWENRKLEFIDAYSAKDALDILANEPDIAIGLVDVVMETDDAGLKLVKDIREKLDNQSIRLILRTGQPGQAPERRVIREYDVSDYKNKTELSGIKLDTLMCASLRSYRDIINLEKSKKGLETVINSSAKVFESLTREKLVEETLSHLVKLVKMNAEHKDAEISGLVIYHKEDQFNIIETVGQYMDFNGLDFEKTLPEPMRAMILEAVSLDKNNYQDNRFVLNLKSSARGNLIFYIDGYGSLQHQDTSLIELFSANIKVTFDNEELRNELEDGQREIVYLLGEAIESRSKETGNHIRRVAEITRLLSAALGYSKEEAEKIKSASPLHDLGKIGIPDRILQKRGKLNDEEWQTMKKHVNIGYDLVKNSKRDILHYAAIIANQHHEKWDGSGYPKGLAGEEIHIIGRISALADVFDALAHERCYKKAWPIDKVLAFIDEQTGTHFDPKVVRVFKQNLSTILSINDKYRDSIHLE